MSPAPKRTKKVHREYVDEDTGVVFRLSHEEPVVPRRPPDNRQREPFVMGYAEGIMALVRSGIGQLELRVILALVARMEIDAPLVYSTSEIAAELGVAAPNVSRAIRRLKERSLLVELGSRTVLVHPAIFWRGTRTARIQWLHRIERAGKKIEPAAPTSG